MMATQKKVAVSKSVQESWGPALTESGLEHLTLGQSSGNPVQADCALFDARQGLQDLAQLKTKFGGPILSVIRSEMNRSDLMALKKSGTYGYLSDQTPPEEVALRLHSMLHENGRTEEREMRTSSRVWFQQEVEFKIFDQTHKAWSTTLSETGLFLRTPLSFPLYSVMHLKFQLFGDTQPFECDGVIVRQEVEGEIRGIGLMFQNLRGENVRRLESFFELYR